MKKERDGPPTAQERDIVWLRFGKTGNPIPFARKTVEDAKRKGRRLNEDEGLDILGKTYRAKIDAANREHAARRSAIDKGSAPRQRGIRPKAMPTPQGGGPFAPPKRGALPLPQAIGRPRRRHDTA